MDKHVTDAFAHSGLERWLHQRGIRSLVFTGVSTNMSVEASVRSAACLGLQCTVVADACYTFDRPDLDGTPRSAEDIHRVSLANLQGEYTYGSYRLPICCKDGPGQSSPGAPKGPRWTRSARHQRHCSRASFSVLTSIPLQK